MKVNTSSDTARADDAERCLEVRRTLAATTKLRIEIAGEQHELVAPILGENFVVGFSKSRDTWMCFRKPKVMRFEIDADARLPRLRRRTSKFEQIISEMNPPFAVELKLSAEQSFATVLTSVDDGFVYCRAVSSPGAVIAYGLESLDWLAIVSNRDADSLSGWRRR